MIVRPRESALGGSSKATISHRWVKLNWHAVHAQSRRQENLGEAQHTMEVAFAESAPVLGRQPLRHRGDHLFSMGTASFADYVLAKSCHQDMS